MKSHRCEQRLALRENCVRAGRPHAPRGQFIAIIMLNTPLIDLPCAPSALTNAPIALAEHASNFSCFNPSVLPPAAERAFERVCREDLATWLATVQARLARAPR